MKLALRPKPRTWAAPAKPTHSQDEQRHRRRHWLLVSYDGSFDLVDEIRSIAAPLAEKVAADPSPTSYMNNVTDLAGAVHRCVGAFGDIVLDGEDRRRVEHLATAEDRARALRLLREHRAGRSRPTITDAALVEATWPESLADLAQPVSGPLAAFLARPPSDWLPTASQRVEAALREIDTPAISLARRIDRRALDRETFARPPVSVDKVAAELAALGVEL